MISKIKNFIKNIIFYKFYTNLRKYTWKGVYLNWSDLPSDVRGFDSNRFVNDTFMMTKNRLSKKYSKIPAEIKDENALLPLLAAIMCHKQLKVRILDFGGGMGISYIHIRDAIPNGSFLDYHIIEQEKMCMGGASLFCNDDHIHFHTDLPVDLSDIDIVYINSALQYINDYLSLLKKLSAYKPTYFLFVRLSAGDVPTYITVQENVPDVRIPYYFFNVDEIVSIMGECGYQLIFKGALGKKYSMDNLPPENRLEYQSNLLFAKKFAE